MAYFKMVSNSMGGSVATGKSRREIYDRYLSSLKSAFNKYKEDSGDENPDFIPLGNLYKEDINVWEIDSSEYNDTKSFSDGYDAINKIYYEDGYPG